MPPAELSAAPQLPLPMPVVNASLVALEPEPLQVHGGGMVVDVVEVVVVAHSPACGSQRSVILVLAFPAFPLILQLPALVPCFFVRTVTPAKAPHTELVPLALTWTFPTPLHRLEAWMFLCLRSFAVQPLSVSFTHSAISKTHFLLTAVWQTVPWSVTRPLVCSWNRVGHWPCAWLARGASATVAANTRTDASPGPDPRWRGWRCCIGVLPFPLAR